jgi:hypothetical protein
VIRGMASCVTSALWPERVTGLVSYAGYDIVDLERLGHAFAPALEHVQWYQHLFQLERGRGCLAQYRRELCRVLWEQWSPSWKFDDSTFERTASSFDNPDFVDAVIHRYRFCFGTAAGDPALASLAPAWRQNQDRHSHHHFGWQAGSAQAQWYGGLWCELLGHSIVVGKSVERQS